MHETLVEKYDLEDHARMTLAEESMLEVNATAQLAIYDIDDDARTDEVSTVRELQRLQPSRTLYSRGSHEQVRPTQMQHLS